MLICFVLIDKTRSLRALLAIVSDNAASFVLNSSFVLSLSRSSLSLSSWPRLRAAYIAASTISKSEESRCIELIFFFSTRDITSFLFFDSVNLSFNFIICDSFILSKLISLLIISSVDSEKSEIENSIWLLAFTPRRISSIEEKCALKFSSSLFIDSREYAKV